MCGLHVTMLMLITPWHETIKIARVDNYKIWLCSYERRPKSTIKMEHLLLGFPYLTNLISHRILTLVRSTCIYKLLITSKTTFKQEMSNIKAVRLYIDGLECINNLCMNAIQAW